MPSNARAEKAPRSARGVRGRRTAGPAVPPPVLFQPPQVFPSTVTPFAPHDSGSASGVSTTPATASPTASIDIVTTGPITKTPFRIDGAAPTAPPEPITELPTLGAAAPATPRKLPAGNVTPLSAAVSRERKARENYLQRSRDLERAAAERLSHEQALLAQRVREQLDRERRQLSDELDTQLEDTMLITHSGGDR